MTRRKKIYWIVSIIAIVALVIVWSLLRSGGGDEFVLYTVERGAITEYVSETGKVMAVEDIDLFFKQTGRVDEIFVKEGDEVEEGDALLKLDTAELNIRRREAVAALSSAQASYAQALKGASDEDIRVLEVAIVNAETDLAADELAFEDTKRTNVASLDKAESDYVGTLESLYLTASTTVQTLRNDVFDAAGDMRTEILPTDGVAASEASASFNAAQEALGRMDSDIVFLRGLSPSDISSVGSSLVSDGKLVRDGAAKVSTMMQTALPGTGITETQLDARTANIKAAWVGVNAAVNAAESQKLFVVSTDASNNASLNAARKIASRSKGLLSTAQEKLEALKAPLRDVDKAVYFASIASARASLELANQQISDATLVAPTSGIVGSIDIDLGELSTTAMRSASMISSQFEIESDVSELDIAKIRTDQPVEVAFDAFPERIFMGRVTTIAPRETANDDDIFYAVKVTLEESDAPLRSGMTADLDINVGEKSNVLLVPRRQVIRREGKTFVKVMIGKDTEDVEVKIGLLGDTEYEVLEGLSEGDQIVIER